PNAPGKQHNPADKPSIVRQKETQTPGAMAGNFQHLELGPENLPARRLSDKKVRVRRLDFEFETEAAKKFSIRNHRRSERVTADWTIELPLDPGDILHVIDVSVRQEQKFQIDSE